MKATKKLHDIGQSIWLDNITRALLTSGGLKRYIDDLSVTGLTSNPTIFDLAIRNSADYDGAIRTKTGAGLADEKLFFELALEDLTQAADLSRSKFRRSSRTTPKARSRRPAIFTGARNGPTCSSRFPARAKAAPRSKKPSLPVCP